MNILYIVKYLNNTEQYEYDCCYAVDYNPLRLAKVNTTDTYTFGADGTSSDYRGYYAEIVGHISDD